MEPLCVLDMYYRGEDAWVKPFGEKKAAGFGGGDGTVTGDRLAGKMAWSNHPRRREDGVWCPDLNGFIVTGDGAKVLVAIQGYSIQEDTPEFRRAITAIMTFQASDPKYRWLNFVVGVGEGEIVETAPGRRKPTIGGSMCPNASARPRSIRRRSGDVAGLSST